MRAPEAILRFPFVVLALGAALGMAACGGAAVKGAEAPSSASEAPAEREPATLEEAQAQLDRARRQLGTGSQGAQPESSPPPAKDSAAHPTGTGDEAPTSATAPSPCGEPCRAIASMRRAVSAICRIAGDVDARCQEAKKTLADSESRVGACGC